MDNKKLKLEDSFYFWHYDRGLWYLEDEIFLLLVLSELYNKNIISLDKLKGQLKSLKKGDLQQYKRTYHCTINDKWYNDETAREIFKDLFETYKLNYISVKTLVEVTQLYLNKNYNYSIDFIVSNIFKPFLNSFSNSQGEASFENYINVQIDDFPEIKIKGYKSECYECGNEHFNADHRQTIAQIDNIIDFFHQYKKGNLTKIPKQNL